MLHNEKRRRAAGVPERRRGAAERCPQGHLKAENLRPGRYDCASCHRDRQRERGRKAGAKPAAGFGENWKCGHDPVTSARYCKGKEKGCKVCHREKQRLVPYDAEKVRDYVSRNREAVNAYRKAWRAANRPDRVEFRQGGPEAVSYARFIGNDPCVYCGGSSQAIDHINPVTRGGMGEWSNLAPICTSCNSSKSNKHVLQFLMYRLERIGARP
ncbi:HNH endonuclease [Streptomyces sp. NPDC005900]|uniref:HNH endonuclease n=1 Tax=Streptomyces sp. NPDC005900 TaxID=3154569 RepID=UPI0033E6878E